MTQREQQQLKVGTKLTKECHWQNVKCKVRLLLRVSCVVGRATC